MSCCKHAGRWLRCSSACVRIFEMARESTRSFWGPLCRHAGTFATFSEMAGHKFVPIGSPPGRLRPASSLRRVIPARQAVRAVTLIGHLTPNARASRRESKSQESRRSGPGSHLSCRRRQSPSSKTPRSHQRADHRICPTLWFWAPQPATVDVAGGQAAPRIYPAIRIAVRGHLVLLPLLQ